MRFHLFIQYLALEILGPGTLGIIDFRYSKNPNHLFIYLYNCGCPCVCPKCNASLKGKCKLFEAQHECLVNNKMLNGVQGRVQKKWKIPLQGGWGGLNRVHFQQGCGRHCACPGKIWHLRRQKFTCLKVVLFFKKFSKFFLDFQW